MCVMLNLVDIRKLAERLGVSVSKAWRIVRDDPRAPRPIKVGPMTTRFRSDEIDRFIESLAGGEVQSEAVEV